jgi:hypothetical protein
MVTHGDDDFGTDLTKWYGRLRGEDVLRMDNRLVWINHRLSDGALQAWYDQVLAHDIAEQRGRHARLCHINRGHIVHLIPMKECRLTNPWYHCSHMLTTLL